MTAILVFVNERPVEVASPATVVDAVTAFDSELGAALRAGTARATDARGIDIAGTEPVGHGSILRVVTSSRPHALTSEARPHAIKSVPDAHA